MVVTVSNQHLIRFIKRAVIGSFFILSQVVYAGGPDMPYSYEDEFFGGVAIGGAQGPGLVTSPGSALPVESYEPPGLFQTPNVFQLQKRGNFFYSFLLGFNFNDYIGLYFDYNNWGDQSVYSLNDQNDTIADPGFSGHIWSSSFGTGVTGYYPLDEGLFSFFGSLGVEFMTSELNFTTVSLIDTLNPGDYSVRAEQEVALLYSMGAQFNLGKYVALRFAWQAISRLGDSRISNMHYNAYLLGLYGRYSV